MLVDALRDREIPLLVRIYDMIVAAMLVPDKEEHVPTYIGQQWNHHRHHQQKKEEKEEGEEEEEEEEEKEEKEEKEEEEKKQGEGDEKKKVYPDFVLHAIAYYHMREAECAQKTLQPWQVRRQRVWWVKLMLFIRQWVWTMYRDRRRVPVVFDPHIHHQNLSLHGLQSASRDVRAALVRFFDESSSLLLRAGGGGGGGGITRQQQTLFAGMGTRRRRALTIWWKRPASVIQPPTISTVIRNICKCFFPQNHALPARLYAEYVIARATAGIPIMHRRRRQCGNQRHSGEEEEEVKIKKEKKEEENTGGGGGGGGGGVAVVNLAKTTLPASNIQAEMDMEENPISMSGICPTCGDTLTVAAALSQFYCEECQMLIPFTDTTQSTNQTSMQALINEEQDDEVPRKTATHFLKQVDDMEGRNAETVPDAVIDQLAALWKEQQEEQEKKKTCTDDDDSGGGGGGSGGDGVVAVSGPPPTWVEDALTHIKQKKLIGKRVGIAVRLGFPAPTRFSAADRAQIHSTYAQIQAALARHSLGRSRKIPTHVLLVFFCQLLNIPVRGYIWPKRTRAQSSEKVRAAYARYNALLELVCQEYDFEFVPVEYMVEEEKPKNTIPFWEQHADSVTEDDDDDDDDDEEEDE